MTIEKKACVPLSLESMPEILARPSQSLAEHINNLVQQIPTVFGKAVNMSIYLKTKKNPVKIYLSQEFMDTYLQVLLALHDFGKVNPFFQQKIHYINQTPGINKLEKPCKVFSYHANTSAIVAFYAVVILFKEVELINNKLMLANKFVNGGFNQEKIIFNENDAVIDYLYEVSQINDVKGYLTFFFAVIGASAVLMHHNKELDNILVQIFNTRVNEEYLVSDLIAKSLIDIKQLFLEATNAGRNLGIEVFGEIPSDLAKKSIIEAIWLTTILPEDEEDIKENILEYFEDQTRAFFKKWEKQEEITNLSYSLFFNFVYSFLCDADEWDAKFYMINEKYPVPFEKPRYDLPYSIITSYKEKKFGRLRNESDKLSVFRLKIINNETKKVMNLLRNLMFSLIDEKINLLRTEELSKNIFVIDAPTGLGKTLNLLNFGVKIKNKLKHEKGQDPRIFYVLPFISIIDQVGSQFFEILLQEQILPQNISELNNKKEKLKEDFIQTEILCLNHHLADTKLFKLRAVDTIIEEDKLYEIEEAPRNEELVYEKFSYHYINTWQPDIIVTSFVKFFNTIAKAHKRELIRFHKIAGSVILIDEIQAIPSKYWDLTKETLNYLIKSLGCTIVISSATTPLPLITNTDIDVSKLFSFKGLSVNLNRYNVHLDFLVRNEQNNLITKKTPVLDFIQKLKETISKNPSKNVLVVVNTTKAALLIYNELYDDLKKDKKNALYLLSTQLMPVDRIKIIKKIKDLLTRRSKRTILISTQIIEAGVDLSFDIVFRDFAPLESIIQVAGRCNRNYENKDPAEIHVVYLLDTHNRPYCKQTYTQYLIDLEQTETILKISNKEVISEHEIYDLMEKYFQNIEGLKNTNQLLKDFKEGRFKKMYHDFNIIDEKEYAVTIIIHTNENHEQIKKYFYDKKVKHIPNKLRKYSIETSKDNFGLIRNRIGDETKIKTIKDKDKNPLFYIIHLKDLKHPEKIYSDVSGLQIL